MKEKPKYNYQIVDYINACNSMLFAFCERHDFEFDKNCWVGNNPGGIASVGDYFFDMQTIWYDVTEEPDPEELLRWQDYCQRIYSLGVRRNINFSSWCKGAPRMSEESLGAMETLKKELETQIERAENEQF